MSTRLQWAALGACALLAAAAGFWFGFADNQPNPAQPTQGKTAETALMQAALPDLAGETIRLDQWRGKVVVVNFWATWCAPCREEIPELIRTQEKLADRGVQIVGVAVDQLDQVKPYAEEMKINYPILIGGLDAIDLARDAGNDLGALPFTVILDRSGKLFKTELGKVDQQKLEQSLIPLL